MNFHDIKNVHFVGIGGMGMSGMAEILSVGGVKVSGCDVRRSAVTDLLSGRGMAVTIGHDPSHVAGMDCVVYTAAVRGASAEIDAAAAKGIRVMRRSEMLGAIVDRKRSIGVSGTHGKTSTSAMISVVLESAGLDPTVIVGGMVRNLATNAKAGKGEFLVVEADEYDRTFHHLHPEIAVVTNIEADHLEYYGSLEKILEAFRIFIEGVKPGGVVIGCVDDPAVALLLDQIQSHRVVRYGISAKAEIRATRLRFSERSTRFDVKGMRSFAIYVPGEHNIRNSLAAIAVARELGISPDATAAGLAKYLGVDRRFQILGLYEGAIVVDDYAHHPTEISATLEAARKGYPNRRIVALFQPHLYSRTRDFAREFAQALLTADVPLLAPIFAAREAPMEGITAKLIADQGKAIEFLEMGHAEILDDLRRRLQPDDIFITMGAGDVNEIAQSLVAGGRA